MTELKFGRRSRCASWFGTIACYLATAGCGAIQETRVTAQQVDGWTLVGRSAETQLAVMRTPESRDFFCMAPQPDSVATFSEGVSLADSLGGGNASVGESASRGAASLGGRSPRVLLAREVLYRACEIAMNQNLSPEEAVALYREAVLAITPAFDWPHRGTLAQDVTLNVPNSGQEKDGEDNDDDDDDGDDEDNDDDTDSDDDGDDEDSDDG